MHPVVCVTGAQGFIGKHLCCSLEEHGAEVLRLGVTGTPDITCDLHDYSAVSAILRRYKPTHMVHLAWCAGRGYAENIENVRWMQSSIYLINTFYECGGQRFAGIGSCFEYASAENTCCESSTATLPATLYGKTKLALGAYLQACATGLKRSWVWCRPFYITGPGESAHRLVPAACAALSCGETFTTTAPNHVLDYMDVRDVAAGLAKILWADYCGIVNVGSGKGIAVIDLLKKIRFFRVFRG